MDSRERKGTLRYVDITTYKVGDHNMSEVVGVVGSTYPVGGVRGRRGRADRGEVEESC